jgi:hypothetical protein
MKPYSANGNPNAKEVKLPPTPKEVHVPRPDEGQISELGTILMILVGAYTLPDLLALLTKPSLWNACRFFFSVALAVLVLKGSSPARWIMVAFSGLSAFFLILAGVGAMFSSVFGFIAIVFGLVPLGIAIALVVPPLSRHFEG